MRGFDGMKNGNIKWWILFHWTIRWIQIKIHHKSECLRSHFLSVRAPECNVYDPEWNVYSLQKYRNTKIQKKTVRQLLSLLLFFFVCLMPSFKSFVFMMMIFTYTHIPCIYIAGEHIVENSNFDITQVTWSPIIQF